MEAINPPSSLSPCHLLRIDKSVFPRVDPIFHEYEVILLNILRRVVAKAELDDTRSPYGFRPPINNKIEWNVHTFSEKRKRVCYSQVSCVEAIGWSGRKARVYQLCVPIISATNDWVPLSFILLGTYSLLSSDPNDCDKKGHGAN